MDAKVAWKTGLSFTGTVGTGFQVPLDSEPEVGGKGEGFRPLQLMGLSLAGCTAMDVISILRKKKQDVTAFEVQAHASQAEDFPKVFTHVTLTYVVTGHTIDEKALLRSIELSATKYCPAQAMLSRVVPIDLVYEIYEEEGSGRKRLIKRDNFVPQQVT